MKILNFLNKYINCLVWIWLAMVIITLAFNPGRILIALGIIIGIGFGVWFKGWLQDKVDKMGENE